MNQMDLGQRIMIMGASGSGKSTMARRLGELHGLPVVHLDALYWKPGWIQSTIEEIGDKIRAAEDQPCWVIDGNYKQTINYRLARADTVIYLDFNRYICLYRAIRRWMKNYGKTRPDLGEGCPDKLDLPFVKWIFWDYPRKVHGATLVWLAEIEPPKRVYHLKGNRAVKRFYLALIK